MGATCRLDGEKGDFLVALSGRKGRGWLIESRMKTVFSWGEQEAVFKRQTCHALVEGMRVGV